MKNKLKTGIALKKLTIAKINRDKMQKVQGGDCLPTEHRNSYVECESTLNVF